MDSQSFRRQIANAVVLLAASAGVVVFGTGCERESQPEATPVEPAVADEVDTPTESDEKPAAAVEIEEPDPLDYLPDRLRRPRYSPGSENVRMYAGNLPDEVDQQLDEKQEANRSLRVDFDPSQWDEPYSNLEKLEVLTTGGPQQAPIDRVVRSHNGFGWENHLVTEPVENLGAGLDGTFYAGPGVFSENARMGTVDDEPVDERLAADIWELFWEGSLPESYREAIEEYFEHTGESVDEPDLDDHIQEYRARFTPDHPRLVTVELAPSHHAGPRWIDCIAAGYLVDEAGENIEEAKPVHAGFHCLSPSMKVDLEGDGTWGVLYTIGTETHPFDLELMEFDDSNEPSHRAVYGWD